MKTRILLIGDDSGLPILLNTIETHRIAAVITASIRAPLNPLLANEILNKGIPILKQPTYLHPDYAAFYLQVKMLEPDCIICNSYSMLIREDLLQLVNYYAFNVHAAYLPFNRGPNPIQWAILNQNTFTGVTLHQMDKNFDSGDLVHQLKEPIYFEDTWLSVSNRLNLLIHELISVTIPSLLAGTVTTVPQDNTVATKNFRLTPDFPQINFDTMSDLEIYNLTRAQVKPLKGAFYIKNNKTFYIDEFLPYEQISDLRKNYYSTDLR